MISDNIHGGHILRIASGIITLAILLLAGCAGAATWTVDDSGGANYTKIQDAINNASAGDNILVNSGTYYEEITLKNGLILIGENPWSTIIDGGNNSGDIVTLTSGSATIKGFTIKGAISGGSMPGGAGIFINNAGTSLTAINNIIIENDNGIKGWNQVTLVAKNNIIARNNYDGVESWIYVTLENNVIVNNGRSGWNDWSGAWGSYTFENNIIVNNSWYGFAKHRDTPLYIEYNDVWNNAKGNYIQGYSGCCEDPFTPSPGTGELSLNPLFSSDRYYTLQENSPLTDAGNPNVVYNDLDGSRNDMGIYGGQNKMPAPPTVTSISGFKINDTNGNGKWNAGEKGISNWTIRLIGITGKGKNVKVIRKEILTDATGFYNFDNLPAGRYFVIEKLKKGFVPTSSPVKRIRLAQGKNSMNNNFTNKPVQSRDKNNDNRDIDDYEAINRDIDKYKEDKNWD